MTTPTPVQSLADIEYDLAGGQLFERSFAQLAVPLSGEPHVRTLRGNDTGPVNADSGQALLAACGPEARKRYQTLVYFENLLPEDADHGILIGTACQVLEGELDRLVSQPARALGSALPASLHARDDRKQVEILENWLAGKLPFTIGIASLLLLALRRGCEQNLEPILEFLRNQFLPGYLELLRTKQLGQGLDRIRTAFRNPACHGTSTFDPPAYEAFAQLMVGQKNFAYWDALGLASAELAAGEAIFHHHLRHARRSPVLPPPAPAPLERLLALKTPDSSSGRIEVRIFHTDAARLVRDLTVVPRGPRPFRLRDPVRFSFQANRPGCIALIDVGTSGKAVVVWPNAWHNDPVVAADQPYFLPSNDQPEFDLVLSGRPGVERLVALLSNVPWPWPLGPDPGQSFRELPPTDLEKLLHQLTILQPRDWAVGHCEWTIAEM